LFRYPASFRRGIKRTENNPYSSLYGTRVDEYQYARKPLIRRCKGPYLYDHDDNRFVDFDLQNGALLLGHAPPRITTVVKSWLGRGYAPGYASTSERLTAASISSLLLGEWDCPHERGTSILFFDSVYAAVEGLHGLFRRGGEAQIGALIHGAGDDVPCHLRDLPIADPVDGRDLHTAEPADGESPSRKDADCVLLRIGGTIEGQETLRAIGRLKEGCVPLIGDATDTAAFIRLCEQEQLLHKLDGFLFGDWISAGFPFAAVCMMRNLPKGEARPGAGADNSVSASSLVNAPVLDYASPPIYKLKAAQRCIALIHDLGGIQALIRKHERFIMALDRRFFRLDTGLVHLTPHESIRENYQKIRLQLFKNGFFFPTRPTRSLSISFAHSDELLEHCAGRLNSILSAVLRSS
jgi:hypothetical protein